MFNIPNLFTAANLVCGILAIFLSFCGRIDIAPYFIFGGAILDFFDGFLARLLKQQGELGKQLDSLADMITFGLAPGILMLVFLVSVVMPTYALSMEEMLAFEEWEKVRISLFEWSSLVIAWGDFSWIPFIALLIPFFSMFRLAKFNIDSRQSESFIGLPTPANTLFFTAFPLLMSVSGSMGSTEYAIYLFVSSPEFLIPVIVAMSLLLVSEIPLFALKFKTFHWKGNELRYAFLISCGLLLPLLLFWAIPIIVLLYLIVSIINNPSRRVKTNA